MSKSRLYNVLGWALMIAFAFGAAALVRAQEDGAENGGPVIQIGKADPENAAPQLPPPGDNPQVQTGDSTAPKYWIGLVGGPIVADHPLRAHVDLPENQGLLVVSVVPDSPAAKAGLKKNDILLRANDTDLREMQDLVDLVLTEGEKKGQIDVEVFRRGERETLYITPEERPADAPRPQDSFGQAFGPGLNAPGGLGIPEDLLRQFGDLPFEFRQFGPGVIIDDPQDGANLPDGVSVSISKVEGQPTRITVQRGGETWEVVGDDPESLKQLPEDLRPFVEQMLHGRSFGINRRGPGRAVLPEFGDGRLRERLERMERRMQELQERLIGESDQVADEPLDEAETK